MASALFCDVIEKKSMYSRQAPMPSYASERNDHLHAHGAVLTATRICLPLRLEIISRAVSACSAMSMDVMLRS